MNPKTPDDDKPSKRQASAAVVARRVEELVRVLLDGAEESWDVCEFVRDQEKEPGSAWEVKDGEKPLSYSQIRRYVVKADKLIGESCRASRKKLLRRHLAKRRNLYAKAVSQGDVRAALAVLDSEAKLLDLFPTKDAPPPAAPGVVIIGAVDADAALGRKPAGPPAASGTADADAESQA